MIIVTGAYHWWPKFVGFRNDYCLNCKAERRTVCIRTFDVGHIFWVPVLPVGFWKHWACSVCQRNPHEHRQTQPFFKWAAVVILALMAVAFWMDPVSPDDAWVWWLFRIGAPLCAVLLVVHLLRAPKEPSLKQRLAAVAPADDMVCPFCNTPLVAGTRWSCPACHAIRY